MSMPRVCRVVVVIPARDEGPFIEACLAGLRDQRALDGSPMPLATFGVVVVDSRSTDDTAAVVERFAARHPELSVKQLTSPLGGVAWARRTGMDWAADALGESSAGRCFIASTDADTCAHPKWIATLLTAFDAQPAVSFLGGGFSYPEAFAAELNPLRHYASTWRKLKAVLAPMRYVETPGSNFAIDVETYRAIGGMPLFTVGEDLAVSELAVALGKMGAWLPVANVTSERRAVGNPMDFLTGELRFQAWGSHGGVAFQSCRTSRGADRVLPEITPELEIELTSRCLRYFTRQHVIKPLVLVPRFREPILSRLGLDPGAFERAVEKVSRAEDEGEREPFFLEDRVLSVDAEFHEPVFHALAAAIADVVERASEGALEIPFHVSHEGTRV